MKNLVIVGGGGFGAEAAWVAEDMNADILARGAAEPPWNILGYVDDDPAKIGQEFYGYCVLGLPEDVARDLGRDEVWYYCAIGDNRARERVTVRLSALGWRAATLIHPTAVRAKNVCVGEGTYVAPLSVLSPNCRIGRHAIINQRAAVGHDAILDDFCNICPGAQLNGSCRVGRLAVIGSNASIYQGRRIGDGATVGANSMVVRDVAPETSVIGIPAKKITA